MCTLLFFVFFATSSVLLLWSPLLEHSAPGRHCQRTGARGAWRRSGVWGPVTPGLSDRAEQSSTQLLLGSVNLWLLVWREQPGVGVDPLCVWGYLCLFFFSLTRLSSRMSTAGNRNSQTNCEAACVSVSDCWLLDYKLDVLIHLNQGHMPGPTVKCSERDEALYCICHSALEINPTTFPGLHKIVRVTFRDSPVDGNWLFHRPHFKRFSYFSWAHLSHQKNFCFFHIGPTFL